MTFPSVEKLTTRPRCAGTLQQDSMRSQALREDPACKRRAYVAVDGKPLCRAHAAAAVLNIVLPPDPVRPKRPYVMRKRRARG